MNEITKRIITIAGTVLVVLVIEVLAWQAGYISISLSKTPMAGGVPQPGNIPIPPDMRSLSGTVQEVGSSYLKFKLSATPFEMPGSSVRTANVTKDTSIERITQKDPALFNKEMQDFAKKAQSGTAPAAGLTPPDPFTRTKISLSDIKVGDNISASANDNIIKADTFTATTVSIQALSAPAVPPAPAASK